MYLRLYLTLPVSIESPLSISFCLSVCLSLSLCDCSFYHSLKYCLCSHPDQPDPTRVSPAQPNTTQDSTTQAKNHPNTFYSIRYRKVSNNLLSCPYLVFVPDSNAFRVWNFQNFSKFIDVDWSLIHADPLHYQIY